MARSKSTKDPFVELTWAHLEEWGGSRIMQRGRSYQREGCVSGLARTDDGELVAWVKGSKRYATRVSITDGELLSECTCPFEWTCKHAVAVVLEYLECLKTGNTVSRCKPDDERLTMLEPRDDDENEVDDEYDMEPDAQDDGNLDPSSATPAVSGSIIRYLEGMSKAELIQLVGSLIERHPEVGENLMDRKRLQEGRVGSMVRRVRQLIRAAGEDDGWEDHWHHERFTPDYSGVVEKLEELLGAGHANEVLTLGKELMRSGQEQVERSQDDGMTAIGIGTCVPVIEKALHRSSLPTAQKLTWVVDALLADEYDIFGGLEKYLDRSHDKADWSRLADELLSRLSGSGTHCRGNVDCEHHRKQLGDFAIHALHQAGRSDEVIAFCEKEAPVTEAYERLVKALMNAKRFAEAERWIREGIEATEKKLPGIAADLRGQFMEIRRINRDWPTVAALCVDGFVRSPCERSYIDCRKAAGKLNVWDTVRAALLNYLETGEHPWAAPGWPLPTTGTETKERRVGRGQPDLQMLVQIAIHEKQPEQVLRWFDRMPKGGGIYRFGSVEEAVADAVKETHPDRAATIWKTLAERWIAEVQPKAYRAAAIHLKKLKNLLTASDRSAEWSAYVSELRARHARKRSLLEVPDSVEGRPIVGRR
jgi:uncharacterized Zn finger protein